MAIRSKILPQSRISVHSGVAAGTRNLSRNSSPSLACNRLGRGGRPVPRRLSHQVGRVNRLARTALFAGLSLVVLGTGGCSMFSGAARQLRNHDGLNEFMIGHRNKTMAAKAWHCQKANFCNPSNAFKDGFIAGYMDIANGGNGCTPAIAPSQYWGWMYQSSNGQLAVNDWFAGFPMGVKAAEQDGVGHWSNVQMSYGAPPPNLAAPLPVQAAPTVLDYEPQPTPLESPFLDADDESPELIEPVELDGGVIGPQDRLQDGHGFHQEDSSFQMQNGGGYSFSASSESVPDLEPKASQEVSYSDADVLDADTIVDQVFADQGFNSPVAASEDPTGSAPVADSPTSKLPFSFQ
ncbi:hypothetical protein RMSM_02499 [Rhodopirellula maiorica SM1]|uniref:Uncharacterized protein n=1 Tax=Rhodopirellula maiorica SM1 TaxID=1265738 RepID=M5S307_9BACT|nr:hypothetical protein RMSM_02499 [Rhodopirellula maiorica SM1]